MDKADTVPTIIEGTFQGEKSLSNNGNSNFRLPYSRMMEIQGTLVETRLLSLDSERVMVTFHRMYSREKQTLGRYCGNGGEEMRGSTQSACNEYDHVLYTMPQPRIKSSLSPRRACTVMKERRAHRSTLTVENTRGLWSHGRELS